MNKPASLPCNFAATLDWNDVRYAVFTARRGSLAAAARELGVDQTTVSRRLRALETQIGTPLFERQKGLLSPTPAGLLVLARGERIEEEMAAIRHLLSDHQQLIQGSIRITAVDALISHYLVPQLGDLHQRYPQLALELFASGETLNLSRREADIGIRLARPQDGDLLCRRLCRLSYAVYASRQQHITDRAAWPYHPWLAYDHTMSHLPEMRWLTEQVSPQQISLRCNTVLALIGATVQGLGLALLPRFLAAPHPELHCLSGPEPVLQREIWLVLPRELGHIPRVRAVSNWLTERFTADAAQFE